MRDSRALRGTADAALAALVRWIRGVFRRTDYIYGFFMAGAAAWSGVAWKETVMDLWFVGLIVVLAGLTWGGIVLCERLLVRP
jgi:hypothetical protein